jgi:hypothetical protein
MVHIRAILSNDSDTGPWTFDGRDQRLTMNAATLAPALITSSTQGAPVVTVPAGQKRTVEMYFPPPAGVKTDNVTGFDLLWRVRTSARTVAERTPFERREIEPQPRYAVSVGLGLGWGPLWWYDPYYYPFFGYAYPPVIHFGVGPYYGYRGYRHRAYAGGFHGPAIAPPAAALPPNRAFRSVPALPPSMPAQPRISAPVPSVPRQPQMSAPARR